MKHRIDLPEVTASFSVRRELLTRTATWSAVLITLTASSGCALLPWSASPPTVHVLAMLRQAGEPMERRFQLQLRIQNPNPKPIEFKGLALTLDLNNRQVGHGVTDAAGSLPAHGETVMSIAVTVSAAPEVLEMLGFADGRTRGELPYTVKGRFTGGMAAQVLGTEAVFESSGSLRLPR